MTVGQRSYRFRKVICTGGWDSPPEIVEVGSAVAELLLKANWRHGYVLWGRENNGIRWYKLGGEHYELPPPSN